MSRHHRRKQRFKLRSFYVWHRYMGVSAAVFVLLIAITGLLLNHTGDLALDKRYVTAGWVLDWYGIQAPGRVVSFPAGNERVTLLGDHLYLGRREIDGEFHDLVGAVELHDIVAAAVGNSIALLNEQGDVIERLRAEDGVPAGISRIGTDRDRHLLVHTSVGYYRADGDFLKWSYLKQVDQETADWSRPAPPEAALVSSLQQHYRSEALPLERLVLDLHSGRFFGKAGPWVFDAAATLLILLSLTGTWIWLRRRR